MGAKRIVPVQQAKGRVQGGAIVAKPYPLMQECIEGGLKGGIRRVFKHHPHVYMSEDELLDEQRIDTILNYIMVDICERFDFPEPGEEA